MCLGGGSTQVVQKPAEAPPAPEATPEEVIAPEETSAKGKEKKQAKTKASGLDAYRSDINTGGTGTGLNVPV